MEEVAPRAPPRRHAPPKPPGPEASDDFRPRPRVRLPPRGQRDLLETPGVLAGTRVTSGRALLSKYLLLERPHPRIGGKFGI